MSYEYFAQLTAEYIAEHPEVSQLKNQCVYGKRILNNRARDERAARRATRATISSVTPSEVKPSIVDRWQS